ncbi:hypothetical protein DCC79_03040 [bacterium]|nr:hypothetical protein [Chloroflexi bacterium CFX6]RIL11981.1 MAG: hypothetical protein DCC79_03040 [bacterium]
MRTISLAVSELDYEAFRRAAAREGRPIAQLIREAMSLYRSERIAERTPLTDFPVLVGHRPAAELPGRAEVWDEISAGRRL